MDVNGVKKQSDRLGGLCRDDLLELHARIAFADITDYVKFDGNSIRLKDSSIVDGQLVAEISSGPEGISVKMADKNNSLEYLARYLGLLPPLE